MAQDKLIIEYKTSHTKYKYGNGCLMKVTQVNSKWSFGSMKILNDSCIKVSSDTILTRNIYEMRIFSIQGTLVKTIGACFGIATFGWLISTFNNTETMEATFVEGMSALIAFGTAGFIKAGMALDNEYDFEKNTFTCYIEPEKVKTENKKTD